MFCNFSLKKVIIRMFSLILFLGCAGFVTYRGYECFQKYLEKPEAIDVAFKSSASQNAFFPLITFCSWEKPLKENILKGCNLNSEDYLKKNIWVGQGHANCTDPKVLRNQINYGLDDLKMEIGIFYISTYEKSQQDIYEIYPNDTKLQWTSIMDDFNSTCYTMTLPETMVELGIDVLRINFESTQPSLALYWHEDGLFDTDMPDSCPGIIIKENGYYIPIGHETLELLEYDGEKCEKSKDYKLDKCRHELIERVNSSTGSSLSQVSLIYHTIYFLISLFRKALKSLDVRPHLDATPTTFVLIKKKATKP